MVTNLVLCWIVIFGPGDYRSEQKFKGILLRDIGDDFYVNFYNDMKKKGIDFKLNDGTQRINGNNCVFYKSR